MYSYSEKTENDSHAAAHVLSGEKSSRAPAAAAERRDSVSALHGEIRTLESPLQKFQNSKYELNVSQQLNSPGAEKAPAQLFEDDIEAAKAGAVFRKLSNKEYDLNREATRLLQFVQSNLVEHNHKLLMKDLEVCRRKIKVLHVSLVDIIQQYEADNNGGHQLAFFSAYLAGKVDNEELVADIRNIFNGVMAKTDPNEGMEVARQRFLMFMMQGLSDDIGIEQYRALNENLGHDHRLKIDEHSRFGLSGGLQDKEWDEGFSTKEDDGDIHLDEQLWTQGGGTLVGYLREKLALPYDRQPNPNTDQISDMQLNMDTNDDLLAIFAGVNDEDKIKFFAPPKKMTVHHEVGHMNSMLEGKSGGGKRLGGKFSKLTDQEELYNIWLGPRSDRAYGQSLGYPERFEHQTLITYSGPGAYDSFDDFKDVFWTANELTASIPELVTGEICRLVNSSWGKVTKGFFNDIPDGVNEIKALVNGLEPNLVAIREAAIRNRDHGTEKLYPFTREFYNTLAGMDIDNPQAMRALYHRLSVMYVPK